MASDSDVHETDLGVSKNPGIKIINYHNLTLRLSRVRMVGYVEFYIDNLCLIPAAISIPTAIMQTFYPEKLGEIPANFSWDFVVLFTTDTIIRIWASMLLLAATESVLVIPQAMEQLRAWCTVAIVLTILHFLAALVVNEWWWFATSLLIVRLCVMYEVDQFMSALETERAVAESTNETPKQFLPTQYKKANKMEVKHKGKVEERPETC